MPARCAATTPERLRWDCGDSAVSETQAREAGYGGGTAVRCPLDGLSEGGGRLRGCRQALQDDAAAPGREHEGEKREDACSRRSRACPCLLYTSDAADE